MEKRLEDFESCYICSICKEVMQFPVSYACLHGNCFKCAHEYIEQSKKFVINHKHSEGGFHTDCIQCPVCRKKDTVSDVSELDKHLNDAMQEVYRAKFQILHDDRTFNCPFCPTPNTTFSHVVHCKHRTKTCKKCRRTDICVDDWDIHPVVCTGWACSQDMCQDGESMNYTQYQSHMEQHQELQRLVQRVYSMPAKTRVERSITIMRLRSMLG